MLINEKAILKTTNNNKNFPLDKVAKIAKTTNMAKKYKIKGSTSLRVEEMETVTATQLKNSTADVLERVRMHDAVAITRHEKPSAVLLSWEQYTQLKGGEPEWLGELYEEYHAVLEEMQSPEQKAAAERLFQATPEELGAAAVRGAMRKNRKGYNKR